MNDKPRINTIGHAIDNPERWAVYFEPSHAGQGSGWYTARGLDEDNFDQFETFAEAIEYAQKQARQ